MAEPDPGRVPPAVYAKAVRWHRTAQEAFARSVGAGVRVALGTDAGLTAPHGANLRELGLMVRFGGMTPLQAIRAATADAAELCGVADALGSLTAGRTADLVVCGTDPLADIDSLGSPDAIHAVVKEGASRSTGRACSGTRACPSWCRDPDPARSPRAAGTAGRAAASSSPSAVGANGEAVITAIMSEPAGRPAEPVGRGRQVLLGWSAASC
ncbi:amidohydrolase family protein [Streptomyces zhihengii]